MVIDCPDQTRENFNTMQTKAGQLKQKMLEVKMLGPRPLCFTSSYIFDSDTYYYYGLSTHIKALLVEFSISSNTSAKVGFSLSRLGLARGFFLPSALKHHFFPLVFQRQGDHGTLSKMCTRQGYLYLMEKSEYRVELLSIVKILDDGYEDGRCSLPTHPVTKLNDLPSRAVCFWVE